MSDILKIKLEKLLAEKKEVEATLKVNIIVAEFDIACIDEEIKILKGTESGLSHGVRVGDRVNANGDSFIVSQIIHSDVLQIPLLSGYKIKVDGNRSVRAIKIKGKWEKA